MIDKMVVNLHLLDACNFNCEFCFAHFEAKHVLPFGSWKAIVDNVLDSHDVRRFNLAGGEPLLYKDLLKLTGYIRSRGSEVSIITNGYGLSRQKVDALHEYGMSMIGFSIDSANPATLRRLGRRTAAGDILEPATGLDLCRHIREKGIALKINTTVSQLNCGENFSAFVQDALPERWKLLKVKKFKSSTFDNSPLLINDVQFDGFVRRHSVFRPIVERTMANAYIMIDAFGNLVDTGSYNNSPVADLQRTNFRDAFSRIEQKFDYAAHNARYAA